MSHSVLPYLSVTGAVIGVGRLGVVIYAMCSRRDEPAKRLALILRARHRR